MMGFQMRFCPVLNKIKNVINSKKYGKLNQVIIHNGENISNYHNYENYEGLMQQERSWVEV